jgi:hypothetical protein
VLNKIARIQIERQERNSEQGRGEYGSKALNTNCYLNVIGIVTIIE